MKKIYAIYCTVTLSEKPAWFDAFRARYDRPHPLHITLKQMAYTEESELPKIKGILEDILDTLLVTQEKLVVIFDNFLLDEHDPDDGLGYMYIGASQRNPVLDDLQIAIRERLNDYSDYYFKDSLSYEHDFKPHIALASGLDVQTFAAATKQLPKTVKCVGEVTAIVLSCVTEPTLVEANNPDNLISYKL
ncbi:MAG: 2'-5' RNA ligase family protein [Candidatus Saccharimonadales bacterium]